MPTSDFRRFLPSARRACASLVASGLVLGLAATTAVAAPSRAAPERSDTTDAMTGTVAEPLDPTFVQEGMPSPHGGQVVAWGNLGGPLDGNSPRALPNGVYAVGLSTDEHQILVLRSDGRVDSHLYSLSRGDVRQLTPPEGTTFTAVSADWFGTAELLRSDGVVVNASGEPTKTPPAGLEYTAISGHLALRSDGTLDPAATPDEPCAEMRDQGTGLHYTAIAARPGLSDWAALRSDGAFVHCQALAEGSESTVVAPPAGTHFVGIDMGSGEALGATADGRIVSSSGTQLADAPAGRSIVSLAAMEAGEGAAALDDGSILSWGLSGEAVVPPAVPAGRDVFSAVGGFTGRGQHWAIMVGDPVPVEVAVEPTLPADRPLRVTDSVRVDVSATLADGTPVAGQAESTVRGPDGQTRTLEPMSLWSDSAEIILLDNYHEQIGTHTLDLTFSGSPYVTTTVETALDFIGPSPVALTTSGPTTWHQGTENTLCFTLATDDGSPLWWTRYGQATISVEGDPGRVQEVGQPSWPGSSSQSCMWYLGLQPGTYTAHFDYEGWGEADSASWTGQVVVLPPAATRVESDLPSSWRYGQMPDVLWAEVTSDGSVPIGSVYLEVDDLRFGFGAQLDSTGRGRLWIGSEEELVPGTYPMVVEYRGGSGFLPSRLERTVTVEPGLFTAPRPTVTGTAKVGKTLTVSRGTWSPAPSSVTYVWKANGVTISTRTTNTFVVPAAARGKRLTVTVVGSRAGYTTKSVTSWQTSTVAPGTFTAPRPTITGTKRVGSTLTVSRGTWSPQPSSVTYVWKADGVKIATRTSNRFVIPSQARGKHLTVTVIGSRTGYTTKSVTSYRTVTIR
jgi:hypothetical protein